MCWKGKDPKSPRKRILCLWVECNFFMQVQRFNFPWALAEFSLWICPAAEPRHGSAITAGRSHYVLPWCHFASPSWSILHILHQLLPHPSRGRTEKDSVQATSHSVTARRQNAGGGGLSCEVLDFRIERFFANPSGASKEIHHFLWYCKNCSKENARQLPCVNPGSQCEPLSGASLDSGSSGFAWTDTKPS